MMKLKLKNKSSEQKTSRTQVASTAWSDRRTDRHRGSSMKIGARFRTLAAGALVGVSLNLVQISDSEAIVPPSVQKAARSVTNFLKAPFKTVKKYRERQAVKNEIKGHQRDVRFAREAQDYHAGQARFTRSVAKDLKPGEMSRHESLGGATKEELKQLSRDHVTMARDFHRQAKSSEAQLVQAQEKLKALKSRQAGGAAPSAP